ncbi:MAG: hypothetical protein B6230_06830 [Desulfobacteraceae bacterium 4572_89]|nr:MAG: hypothetical protein B6230_06830 [Desulfobacteraceae bacterium 4572_89]
MFKTISLRSRIFFVFLVMAMISLVGGLLTLWYTFHMDRTMITMVQKEMVIYKAAQDMELAMANQKGFLTYFFVDGDVGWLQSLGKYREVFRQSIQRASSLALTSRQQATIDAIASEYAVYIKSKDEAIVKYFQKDDAKKKISKMHEKQRSVFFSILNRCRQFSMDQWALISRTQVESRRHTFLLQAATAGGMFLYAICWGVSLFLLYRRILEPIRNLAMDAGSSPQESSRDEVISLGYSLKGMFKDFDDTHDALIKSRENLVQAEKMAMVGEMAAGMAHTIRNPVTSIKMRMFSLGRSMELSEIQNEDLMVMSGEIGRIDRIVQNFLEFSRPPKMKIQKCRMSEIIESILVLLEYRIKEYGVEIIYEDRLLLPDIEVDRDRIKEGLVNLIMNACEAMGHGGRIWITQALTVHPERGRMVEIHVKDSGPGVPTDIMDRILLPFFTTKDKGSGLGLSIVDRIVREHRGLFIIASGNEGGAEFVIKLPVEGEADGFDFDS